MLNIKNIFQKPRHFDDAVASIWFGAAVPFVVAFSVTVSYLVSWVDYDRLGWLFSSVGGAVFLLVVSGGWLFPAVGIYLAIRGFAANKDVAVASIFLSASELVFYAVTMSSIYFNSTTLID